MDILETGGRFYDEISCARGSRLGEERLGTLSLGAIGVGDMHVSWRSCARSISIDEFRKLPASGLDRGFKNADLKTTYPGTRRSIMQCDILNCLASAC